MPAAVCIAAAGEQSTGCSCTTSADIIADTRAVLGHVRAHGRGLGIDAAGLELWSCSSLTSSARGQ
jgi:hypothetical protein